MQSKIGEKSWLAYGLWSLVSLVCALSGYRFEREAPDSLLAKTLGEDSRAV